MGCGTSAPVSETISENFTVAQQARRKKNKLSKHSHLLNVIDISNDVYREFRDVAAQRKHTWSDWQAWVNDERDNAIEYNLRESVTQCCSLSSEQDEIDVELVKHGNTYTNGLRDMLQMLKTYDEYVNVKEVAIKNHHDAQKSLKKAEDRNEKAMKKANYDTDHKPKLLAAIGDAKAKVEGTNARVEHATQSLVDAEEKLRQKKNPEIQRQLLAMTKAWREFHEHSMSVCERQIKIIEAMDISPPPPPGAAAARRNSKKESSSTPVPVAAAGAVVHPLPEEKRSSKASAKAEVEAEEEITPAPPAAATAAAAAATTAATSPTAAVEKQPATAVTAKASEAVADEPTPAPPAAAAAAAATADAAADATEPVDEKPSKWRRKSRRESATAAAAAEEPGMSKEEVVVAAQSAAEAKWQESKGEGGKGKCDDHLPPPYTED